MAAAPHIAKEVTTALHRVPFRDYLDLSDLYIGSIEGARTHFSISQLEGPTAGGFVVSPTLAETGLSARRGNGVLSAAPERGGSSLASGLTNRQRLFPFSIDSNTQLGGMMGHMGCTENRSNGQYSRRHPMSYSRI